MPWTPKGSEVRQGYNKLTHLNKVDPAQGLYLRDGSEKFGYYLVDGQRQFRVSSKAPLLKDVGKGRLKALLNYLQLNDDQFKELCRCQMSGPDYHQFIRDKLGIVTQPS